LEEIVLSTHYYVLSLGTGTCSLFEAFRDLLIEVENQGFPVTTVTDRTPGPVDTGHLRKIVRAADECFGHYYLPEPLSLVLVGDGDIRDAFLSVTSYGDAVIGRVDGDHSATSSRDLGQIVWPVVKEAMSGILEDVMCELEVQEQKRGSFSGIEAVARAVKAGERGTLLVDDDYHLRGSIGKTDQLPIISPDIDVREVIDDAVDAIIDKVLEAGGRVVFAPGGSLAARDRIVLIRRGADK
jgi:hypothetical protein